MTTIFILVYFTVLVFLLLMMVPLVETMFNTNGKFTRKKLVKMSLLWPIFLLSFPMLLLYLLFTKIVIKIVDVIILLGVWISKWFFQIYNWYIDWIVS